MECLYKSERVVVFNPNDGSARRRLQAGELPWAKRLLEYVADRFEEYKFSDEDYRFYVLAEGERIELGHKPRIRAQGHVYFTLAELLSGREVVRTGK